MEIQAMFLFFFLTWIKMINPLHVGLILIISKVFTILCLLRLCRNREYPGKFQNKTLISKPFFQMIAQVKWEGKSFWSIEEAYLSLTYWDNVNYNKSVLHPIPTCLWELRTSGHISKQISKLSFQMSSQIYSLLA